MPYKRRNVRKLRKPRKSYAKKTLSPAIRRYVKQAIHTNIENKMFTAYNSNQPIASVATGTVPTHQSLMPAIALGNTVSTRVGNEVRVVKGVAEFIVNLLPYSSLTNTALPPVMVRMVFFSLKQNNINTLSSTITNNFWQVGASSVGPQANLLDMLYTPNKELFTVYKDTKFKLGATFGISSGAITTGGYYDNSSMTKTVKFNWGKHFKRKIKYDDATTVATNGNLFVIMFVVQCDGTGSAGQVSAEYHHVNYTEYEDA